MKEIVRILMRRDGISENEAENLIEECREDLRWICETSGSYDDAVNCIEYWLELEPDYLDMLI